MRRTVYRIATHEGRWQIPAQPERTKVDKKAIRDLTSLASAKLHEKYIDNATGDEYLLPNDLIMDCLSTMEQLMLHSNYKHKDRMLKGRCGRCTYKTVCGGCRIRAEVVHGDIWAEDPACYLSDSEIGIG